MTRYIVGNVASSGYSTLEWTDKPLRLVTMGGDNPKPYIYIGRHPVDVKKGFASDGSYRDWHDGSTAMFYAREMPEDGVDEVLELEGQIAEAEAVIKRLRKERQDLLHALAQRGKRIRAPKKESSDV